MKFEFYPEKELKKETLEIVGKYLGLGKYKAFLFGSRMEGTNFPQADIDIGVEGKKPIPAEVKFEIKEEMEENPHPL